MQDALSDCTRKRWPSTAILHWLATRPFNVIVVLSLVHGFAEIAEMLEKVHLSDMQWTLICSFAWHMQVHMLMSW